MSREIATLAQQALDPGRSVVVAACAGSGKTWLLVARILRLLLAGVAPGEILAITFTRYAAQEMAGRLRDWLALLATADEAKVRTLLRACCVPEAELDAALARGRSLYEQVLSARPALTISTFHSWYIQLLRSAPIEAGALGNLSLSDRTSALIDEAWDLFAEACSKASDDAPAAGLEFLFREYGPHSTRELLLSFLQHRSDWWAYAGRGPDAVAAALETLAHDLGTDPAADLLGAAMGDAALRVEARTFHDLLARNAGRDRGLAEALGPALAGGDAEALRSALDRALLTSEGKPRIRKPSKAQRDRLGFADEEDFLRLHEALCTRMTALEQALADQRSHRFHAAAFAAGVALLEHYQQLKRERQIVDFADVEWLGCEMLTKHELAVTLQFKLDSRYRHILLDEFQDTNPLQWLSLEAWFRASAEADSSPCVFLVGDPKQAIYRFRRAEAKLFDAARDWLTLHQAAVVLSQDESRRCAAPVLDVVNTLFSREPLYDEDFRAHSPHDPGVPGRVEILPLARRAARAPAPMAESDLRDPLSAPLEVPEDGQRTAEAAMLVAQVQAIVGAWEIDAGDGGRRMACYADIMLLVRARTHLQVYERALREAGIPFLTSRRGGLLEALEVQDLVALLGLLVSPFDDLKLAHVLRSPIFGCADEDLLVLAGAPGGTWWERLQTLTVPKTSPALDRARELLSCWLDRADRLPVHDHLDKIYAEGDVERRYAASVPQAMREAVVANLHAFVERALAVDAGRYPSLPRFLDELRDLGEAPAEEAPDEGGVDTGGNAIRILTVHGAKGLEAPIVWLLDAAAIRRNDDSYRVLVDWPPAAPRPVGFSFCTVQREHNRLQRAQLIEEARSDEREELNLLYVAMTRARQVFFASGSEPARVDAVSWYSRLRAAVAQRIGKADADPGASLVWGMSFVRSSDADAVVRVHGTSVLPAAPSDVPDVTPVGRRRGVAASVGQQYGTAFHRVMEVLAATPEGDGEAIARSFGLGSEESRQCVAQARGLLAAPALRRFFDPNRFSRAFNELPVIDERGELRRIDRVVDFGDSLWVLDYKTGARCELAGTALENEYREQVAAYCRTLALVFPDRTVHGVLLFADGNLVSV